MQDGVTRRGCRAIRLDTDRFPGELALTAHFDAGATARMDGVALADIGAVWLRRIFARPLPENLSPLEAAQCARDTRAALDGWLGLLDHAAWLDPLVHVRAAEDKLAQLRAAQRAGFAVPRTVIGNDPAAVRALWAATGGRVVTKLLTPVSRAMGAAPAVYTTSLCEDDLAELDGLALSPMIFQERVAKVRELRVVYVAGHCFTGALPADGDDWRAQRHAGASPWRPATLPDDVAGALDRVMRALGLRFGAADLLVDAAGGHHFLEVNPVGEWGMLERDLGLPIADAIAEVLCRPS